MNLCFRWDIRNNNNKSLVKGIEDGYNAKVFMIHQRKGIFSPHYIESITEDELRRFEKYLVRHWEVLIKMWQPISKDCET